MTDNFSPILLNTLRLEGGETTDSGGHTNYGITQSTYDSYAKANKLPAKNVSDLNMGDVRSVYENQYWKSPKIADISSSKVSGVLFDYGVNAGTPRAIKALQREVGVKADGIIGKQTIAAVDKYIKDNGEDFLAHQILNDRAKFYYELASQNPHKYGRYIDGWINRISKLKEMYSLNQ